MRTVNLVSRPGCAIGFVLLFALAVPAPASAQPAAASTEREAAGIVAKVLCSGVFVSHRAKNDVVADDLSWLPSFPVRVSATANTVTVDTGSSGPRIAEYRKGLGCTLTYGDRPVVPSGAGAGGARPAVRDPAVAIDGRIQRVLENWTAHKPDPRLSPGTRACIVLRRGAIVGESYASGFDRDTLLPGYSMSKSVAMLLTGIAVGQGSLSPDDDHLMPEWENAGDHRQNITVDNLLRMTSGLEWDEGYEHLTADVYEMLAATPDAAKYAAAKPLHAIGGEEPRKVEPGQYWHYSSGSYAILASVLQRKIAADHGDQVSFARRTLFAPLGITSAVVEPDAAGIPQWSAFMYARARDWAKIGQLMLQDGKWRGRKVVSRKWMEYAKRRTLTEGIGETAYGAGIWLYTPEVFKGVAPPDIYFMHGFQEQYVFVIPSREMVIVRLGLTKPGDEFDLRGFLREILQSDAGSRSHG